MDELTLLRSFRNDEGAPDAGALDAGRAALVEHIQATAVQRPARRAPKARLIGTGSLVAAGLAAVLVTGSVVGLGVSGTHGGADSAAAAVLNAAAATTIKTSDPVVGQGQYLEVATKAVYSATVVSRSGEQGTYLASQDGQVYIPADTNDDWFWIRDASKPVRTFGPASERAASADAADALKGEYLRAAGGAFYGSPADPSPADLAALPRDPSALLAHISAVTKGQGVSADGEALVWIADTLRSGIVPADLRAALYKAAARIPGVDVTDRQANLAGRTGVAIGRTERDGTRQELIIDPDTGLLIGERQVLLADAAAQMGVPAGTPMGWTAITTSVVDSVPGPTQ